MELTYAVLYDLLKSTMAIGPVIPGCEDRLIRQILPWTGENKNPDTLYVALGQAEAPAQNLLTVSPLPGSGWRVTVPQDQVLPTVSRIMEAAQKFYHRAARCTVLAEVEYDLQGLFDLSAELMGIQMMLVDRDYVRREYSRTWSETQPDVSLMPVYALEDLYTNNPDFDKTFHQDGLTPYPQYPTPGADFFYYNSRHESFYLGRLLLTIPHTVRGAGAISVARGLCVLAERCYLHDYLRRNRHKSADRLLEIWKTLLRGEDTGEQEAAMLLRQYGWKQDDSFEMLYLIPHGYFHSEQTMIFYANQMESLFPACLCAQMDGALFCLHNLDRELNPDFRQELSGFLRENLFRMGISNPFQNFFHSVCYRRQAEDALFLGQKRNPSLWRYAFSDYVSDYALSRCLEHYPARDLCPRNLRTLLDYDRLHPDSELAVTLYQYYASQFNAQLAAQRLFIHRTTFFYRMNKIQKIAAFHPEDPRETAQILLAFAALTAEQSENR